MDSVDLRRKWDEASPSVRMVVALGALTLIVLIGAIVVSGDDEVPREVRAEQQKPVVFGQSQSRQANMESLAAQDRALEARFSKLERAVEQQLTATQKTLARINQRDAQRNDAAELENLASELARVEAELALIKEQPVDPVETAPPRQEPRALAPPTTVQLDNPFDDTSFIVDQPTETRPPTTRAAPAPAQPTIRFYGEVDRVSSPGTVRSPNELYLPTGSILSGTLLNGLDAPTRQSARNEPHPVLVRIERTAILPNGYESDIAECFVAAAGYGELSAERAYLRSERLACMDGYGQVIEVELDAYAVDAGDGKVGLRGEVVSRNGALLANAMKSGVFSGFSQALSPQPLRGLTINDGAEDPVYRPETVLAYGLGQGVSNALTRLSDYYLSVAEQVFPVIEIHADRRVNFVLTNGVAIERRGASG